MPCPVTLGSYRLTWLSKCLRRGEYARSLGRVSLRMHLSLDRDGGQAKAQLKPCQPREERLSSSFDRSAADQAGTPTPASTAPGKNGARPLLVSPQPHLTTLLRTVVFASCRRKTTLDRALENHLDSRRAGPRRSCRASPGCSRAALTPRSWNGPVGSRATLSSATRLWNSTTQRSVR